MKHIGKKRATGVFKIACAVVIVLLGVGILADSAAVAQGIRDGLLVCGNVLIPSLFPFMVLSGFISRSGYARILSAPLIPITTKVFKLPAHMGVVVLLSLVGGYPVGARMVAGLLEDGEIDIPTAQRMLCFCVNCGPSFLISAVGVGMLMSKAAGVILFATQTLATLLIGAAVSFRVKPPAGKGKTAANLGGASVFVPAVTGASSSMLTMCAFAVLFSGVLALVRSSGLVALLAGILPAKEPVIRAVICGFFEVTSGCLSACALGGTLGFGLISVFVSFSGLSVLFQIISCFEKVKVSFRRFISARLVHAMLSTAMALPLYRHFCGDQAVLLPGTPPILHADNHTLLVSGCLLAMCSILVLCAGKEKR